MKMNTSFDPFGLWVSGPWALVDLSLRFVRSWQEAWLARLQFDGKPAVRSSPTLSLAADRQAATSSIAQSPARGMQKFGCLDGVVVVGGPAPAAEESAPVKAPVTMEKTILAARPQDLAAERAPVQSVAGESASSSPSVTSMLALQARSLSKAVGKAPKAAVAKTAAAPKKSAAATGQAATQAATKVSPKPAAGAAMKSIAAKTTVSAATTAAKKGASKKA